jgi:glyoxylase I family protein
VTQGAINLTKVRQVGLLGGVPIDDTNDANDTNEEDERDADANPMCDPANCRPGVMIRGIHHVAISTNDLDRLVAFYTGLFGFEPVMRTEWHDRPIIDRMIGIEGSAARQVMLKAGNAYLELFEYETPGGPSVDPDHLASDRGYTHFCVDVTDIDAEYQRLSTAGMRFHSSPPSSDELGTTSLRAIYGRDPDGNIVELQEILDPTIPFDLVQTDLIGSTS